jgi:hypothetical protein
VDDAKRYFGVSCPNRTAHNPRLRRSSEFSMGSGAGRRSADPRGVIPAVSKAPNLIDSSVNAGRAARARFLEPTAHVRLDRHAVELDSPEIVAAL